MVDPDDQQSVDAITYERWYEATFPLLSRTADDLRTELTRFLNDFASEFEFRSEGVDRVRPKGLARSYEKVVRKRVANPETLLGNPSAVQDLVAGRVLVRTLEDARRAAQALEANPIGISDHRIENKRSEAGYRAIHADGAMEVRDPETRELCVVPIEIQIKTLAQHVFGQHTHETAYVGDEINRDPRFEPVRNLQRVLSAQLDVIDNLQEEIERVSRDLRFSIAQDPQDETVSFKTVLRLARDKWETLILFEQGQRIAEAAAVAGITSLEELGDVASPTSPSRTTVEEEFRSVHHREPGVDEVICGLIADYGRRQALDTPLEEDNAAPEDEQSGGTQEAGDSA